MQTFSFLATTLNMVKRRLSSQQPTNAHLVVNPELKYTEWTGKKDNHWSDEENWSDGLPFRYLHAYIPRVPQGNHFPEITTEMTLNFTIKNEGVIGNAGRLELQEEGLLQNYGIFKNHRAAQLVNNGKIINQGIVRNWGAINQLNVFCNFHVLENDGVIMRDSPIFTLQDAQKMQEQGDDAALQQLLVALK